MVPGPNKKLQLRQTKTKHCFSSLKIEGDVDSLRGPIWGGFTSSKCPKKVRAGQVPPPKRFC